MLLLCAVLVWPAAALPAFGGLDLVACVGGLVATGGNGSASACRAVGTPGWAANYTSLRKDGTPAFTTEFWFATEDNMVAFENAPFSYLPKYGGFDAAGIAQGAVAGDLGPGWSPSALGPPVDAVGGWAVLGGHVYCFANAAHAAVFDDQRQRAADAVWQDWFGSHDTSSPYAVAGGPFNSKCFTRVPDGATTPAGQDCRHNNSTRTNTAVALALETHAASPSYMRGIDVSHYQGTIDWGKVAGAGIQFACAKATEGTTYVDGTFATNWKGMRQAGLTRCAYHFAHPAQSASAQAQHFVKTVQQAGGYAASKTLQLMLDLETTDGKSASAVRAWTQAFIGELKALTGRPGIIYTGYYFWRDSVGGKDNFDSPLWLASYTHPQPAGVPSAWSAWTFWQYDDNAAAAPGGPAGSVPGIAGHSVDVDYFRYDAATLQRFCFP